MEYSSSTDFLAQYRAISAKLKKRFLRKPNIAEASAQFRSLAKELENQECPHYSAFCCLAVARCEHSMGNSVFESENLLHAARLFLEAEEQSHELLCPSYSEHLQAALSAYRDCIHAYLNSGQGALATSLYLEVGLALRHLGRVREGITYLLKAAELHKPCSLAYMQDLKLVSECKIQINDMDGALNLLTEVQVIAEKEGIKENGNRIGSYTEILNEVEVTRMLLLLLLQPPRYKLNLEHAKLLDRYADIHIDPVDYIEENMYLLLQALMIAVEERNEKSLLRLGQELWPMLNPVQNDILSKVIDRHRNFSIILPVKLNKPKSYIVTERFDLSKYPGTFKSPGVMKKPEASGDPCVSDLEALEKLEESEKPDSLEIQGSLETPESSEITFKLEIPVSSENPEGSKDLEALEHVEALNANVKLSKNESD